MDLLVVAQLITGVATLVVALVLIWQMFLQRKTLEIAHKDADLTMSFLSVNTKGKLTSPIWYLSLLQGSMVREESIMAFMLLFCFYQRIKRWPSPEEEL